MEGFVRFNNKEMYDLFMLASSGDKMVNILGVNYRIINAKFDIRTGFISGIGDIQLMERMNNPEYVVEADLMEISYDSPTPS